MIDDREYQPDFGEGEETGPRRKLARQLAANLVKQDRLSGPPVDVAAIIARKGLKLVVCDVPGSLSGKLYPDQREVLVNSRGRSQGRQRFTMAHELGHWELRHHLEDELPEDSQGFDGAYGSGEGAEGRSNVEIEANTYAAELLMPGAWIRRERKPLSPGKPDQLAELYQVSREAMFYQLMHYKML